MHSSHHPFHGVEHHLAPFHRQLQAQCCLSVLSKCWCALRCILVLVAVAVEGSLEGASHWSQCVPNGVKSWFVSFIFYWMHPPRPSFQLKSLSAWESCVETGLVCFGVATFSPNSCCLKCSTCLSQPWHSSCLQVNMLFLHLLLLTPPPPASTYVPFGPVCATANVEVSNWCQTHFVNMTLSNFVSSLLSTC